MQAGLYAHPQDLEGLRPGGGGGGLAALRDRGWSEVALATAYHAGRWLTPAAAAGGGGLVRFLEDGIVHFRPGADYGDLRPQPSCEVERAGAGGSPLEQLCREAARADVESCAWVVLFHNSRLGRAHPESCVRNALGDRYEYALCPARPEVRAYGCRLVADVAGHDGLRAVELEAAGFMGHKHGSHHDKSSFALPRHLDFLLSYCFCDVCTAALGAHGVDGPQVHDAAAGVLRRELAEGDALAPPGVVDSRPWLVDTLGDAALDALLAHRRATHRATLQAMRGVVAAPQRLALHLQPDPLFTGSQMGQAVAAVADLVDEIVVTHYGETPDAIEATWRERGAVAEVPVRLTFWPRAPQFQSDDDVRRVITLARDLGCVGLRVYHLGLLPPRTMDRLARLLC